MADGLAEYGQHVHAARLARGLTMAQVHAAGGPVPSQLSRLERGQGDPQWSTIIAIHALLGVMPHALTETSAESHLRGYLLGYLTAQRFILDLPSAMDTYPQESR